MRKHHKKWNVVQSRHYTVVLLHLAAATGRQHHRTVTLIIYKSILKTYKDALKLKYSGP